MANSLPIVFVVCTSLVAFGGGAGCSRPGTDTQAEQRRPLLKPPDRRKQQELAEKRRVVADAKGELLPSDESVAGLQLPRGLRLVTERERYWAYRSTRVTLEQLDKFFGPRLFTGRLERSLSGVITYYNAHVKSAPKMPTVTVRLTGLNPREYEVVIEQAGPPPRTLTVEEAHALTEREHNSVKR